MVAPRFFVARAPEERLELAATPGVEGSWREVPSSGKCCRVHWQEVPSSGKCSRVHWQEVPSSGNDLGHVVKGRPLKQFPHGGTPCHGVIPAFPHGGTSCHGVTPAFPEDTFLCHTERARWKRGICAPRWVEPDGNAASVCRIRAGCDGNPASVCHPSTSSASDTCFRTQMPRFRTPATESGTQMSSFRRYRARPAHRCPVFVVPCTSPHAGMMQPCPAKGVP